MPDTTNLAPDIVICGAGIAGISAAYFLAVRQGIRRVLLIDEGPPLSLTSDKSTECYRNWWPGPDGAMVALMNRSIDLLEDLADQSGNIFHLNRRGYLYLTADPGKLPGMLREAQQISALGAGPLRLHQGKAEDPIYQPASSMDYRGQPDGADLILDSTLLKRSFPGISEQVAAGLHVRRAGWLSAQQLGSYLLTEARRAGVQLLRARIQGVESKAGQVQAVRLADGRRIPTTHFVNAAGPLLKEVGRMLGVNLPVFCELHQKIAFNDPLEVISRQAPLLIWLDSQHLPWSEEERQMLNEDPHTGWLTGELPSDVHTRPEGEGESRYVLMLWEYRTHVMDPVWPLPLDPYYPDVALRGLAAMLPGLRAYFDRAPRPRQDGGYYTKTQENRPLIGPLPARGAYVIGALSGYGVMAACAAGELLAQHLTGGGLPEYAPAFALERYQDPAYLAKFQSTDQGQL
jgi:glycine/D-amino acid oxidase-like deaminating enzyme